MCVFCFQNFECEVSRFVSVSAYPTWCWDSWICRSIFFTNLECWPLLLQTYSFSPFFPLLEFSFHKYWVQEMVLPCFWSCVHFSSSFIFLLSLFWIFSIDLFSSSLILLWTQIFCWAHVVNMPIHLLLFKNRIASCPFIITLYLYFDEYCHIFPLIILLWFSSLLWKHS